MLSKSVDGSLVLWDPITGNAERKLKVKGLAESASLCDVSTDERFVVAGNGQGVLFVWNLQVPIVLANSPSSLVILSLEPIDIKHTLLPVYCKVSADFGRPVIRLPASSIAERSHALPCAPAVLQMT